MNIIITGASRGLGKAIAELFAKNGHDLFLTSLSEKRLYDTVQDLVNRFPAVTIKLFP
jgi:short-subunit dehydrogenase